MCDVLVALPDTTKQGTILFGKNSDRPAGECQVLHFSPAGRYAEMQYAYLKLAVDRTHLATMGCRPYWCWGYETGVNEAGVVGGNTAVFTRKSVDDTSSRQPGLIGMELLRLGLSLGETAADAAKVIIEFLERHGQWGSAVRGKDHGEGSYDNAYLLVDRREAWILETTGKRWIAQRLKNGAHAISNELTIRTASTRRSKDLREHASRQGWWIGNEEFDFARAYSDHEHYARQVSHIRLMRSRHLLREHGGTIDAAVVMKILRDHYEDTFLAGPQFHQFLPDFHTLCMHHSPAGFTWGDTATSIIVELDPDDTTPPPLWMCYLPPCAGVYNVYPFSENLPSTVTRPGTAGLGVWKAHQAPQDTFSEASLWWRCSRILDGVRDDPTARLVELRRLLGHIEEHNLRTLVTILSQRPDGRQEELCRFAHKEVEALLGVLSLLEERWHLS